MGMINYMAALLLAFSLSYPTKPLKILWVVWLITWVLEGRFFSLKNFSFNKSKIPSLLLAFLFIWEAISLLWAEEINPGYNLLERQVSFLLVVPLIFFGVNKYYKTTSILFSLILGALTSIIAYYMTLLYVPNYEYFLNQGNKEFWHGLSFDRFQDWSSLIKHRLYYCTILVISVFSLFFLRKRFENRYGKTLSTLMLIAVSILLLAMIFLTGSRSTIIVLLILLVVSAYRGSSKKLKPYVAILFFTISIGTLIFFMKYHPRMNSLEFKDLNIIENGTVDGNKYNSEPRLLIWHAALQHPIDYFVYGLGAGNSTDYLTNIYKSSTGYPEAFKSGEFGTHNQFLSTTMELGIIGGLFLIFYFVSYYRFFSGKNAKRFALYFSLVIAINLITEGMFGRIDGIITMSFFNLFCIWLEEEEKKKEIVAKAD